MNNRLITEEERAKQTELEHRLIERGAKDLSALKDSFELSRTLEDHSVGNEIRKLAREHIRSDFKKAMDLYHRSLMFDGSFSFDCFMRAIEYNRPAAEQFWLPRRKKLLPVCMALQDMEEGKLDELFLSCPPRIGKALADDTPVLTSAGWKKHGDLAVGDEVIGIDGEFKKVIAVHPKCELDVKVEFTNGESIICHENHEWRLFDSTLQETQDYETKRLIQEEAERSGNVDRGYPYRFHLPMKKRIRGEEKEFPHDPYNFGIQLGGDSGKKTPKRIPDCYLTASVSQRIELLAGLLDSCGTYLRRDKMYCFATCDTKLKDTFIQLVSTFGWSVSVTEHSVSDLSGVAYVKRKAYYISFSPDLEIPCKLLRNQNVALSEQKPIAVRSITRVKPVSGNCITVEGDGMYLVGHTLIPTHNSTLIMMFMLWVIGRNSERSNLYCSYTDSVVGVLYNGILEVLLDDVTYAYGDVFPNRKIASTNAKDLLINLDRKKRYASYTGRSLYGTLNGACDCNGYLIGDDLISGIEEAMSKDRLNAAWAKVDNNLLPRAKESAKILWIGTRWSLVDPQGKRIDLLENDPMYADRRWRILNTPALNEEDESNFEYAYGVGFSSEYFKQRRASFERNNDMASWFAQYMGRPIERDGAVFDPADLRYYNGVLPDDQPDRVFMVVDPAWGGGDFVAGPVAFQYGDDIYIHDVVYSNEDKSITQPLIVSKAIKYGISAMKVEGTKMTAAYGEDIDKALRANNYRINMVINTAHFTGNGKRQRIFDKAPDIRAHLIFLSEGYRSKEYSQFMQSLYSFTVTGKQAKHDDAADSLAMLIDFAFFGSLAKVEVFSRPW